MGQPLRNAHPDQQHLDQQLAEIRAHAVEVFGDEDTALIWLDTGLWELGNLSPIEIVRRNGPSGLELARDVLLRIEYGVYS